MISKRRLVSPALAVVALVAFAGSTLAAPAAPTLQTFGTGVATVTGRASATLVNAPGEYSGVYLKSKSQSDKLLANVDFSFTSTGEVAGGAPRFSIPLNTGDGATPYAFIDVLNCGLTTGLVSTNSTTCQVFVGSETFANWDVLAAAHPTWRIASGRIPFIIADYQGSYAVSNIVLR